MELHAPKGTKDVTPKDSWRWQYIEGIIRDICRKYCIYEARTPVIEHTELFARGVGDTTDIVQKEMYTFLDKGERSVTLKPEGTAGIVRMFVENRLYNEAQPTKMYYLNAPIFRYERPQAGRLREHHQFGIEIFGAPLASADAECISLALEILSRLGVKELELHINSIGCKHCRPLYNEKLVEFLTQHEHELCETCRDRMHKNPLRTLDCKEEKCREICASAPIVLESLCDECSHHLDELKSCLDAVGIPYVLDPHIVRGLDYYTKTVFEIISNDLSAQNTVCGGGRYDGLVEQLGGPKTPAVGFGMGLDRLLLLLQNQGAHMGEPASIDIYIAPIGDTARMKAFELAAFLRKQGLIVDIDHVGRSIKAQFKFAGKLNIRYVGILGDSELEMGALKLKNMTSGQEEIVKFDNLFNYIKE